MLKRKAEIFPLEERKGNYFQNIKESRQYATPTLGYDGKTTETEITAICAWGIDHVIVGFKNGEVKLWDLAKEAGDVIIKHEDEVKVIAKYDEAFIISGSLQKMEDEKKDSKKSSVQHEEDKVVAIHDAVIESTNMEEKKMDEEGKKKYVIPKKTLRIYSARNNCCFRFTRAVSENIHSIAVSEEIGVLAIATVDRFIHVYNLNPLFANESPTVMRIFKSNHTDLILSLVIVPSQFLLTSGNSQKSTRFFSSGILRTDQEKEVHMDMHIVSVGWDKRISVWPIVSHEEGKKIPPLKEFSKGHRNAITTAVFLQLPIPGDRVIPVLITGSLDKTVIIWDYSRGEKVKSLVGHSAKINAVQVIAENIRIDLSSLITRTKHKSFQVHDRRFPLIVTASEDRTIRLWDFRSGQSIRTILFTEALTTLMVSKSSEGIQIMSSSKSSGLLIWNLPNQRQVVTYETAPVTAIDLYQRDGQEHVLIGTVDDTISIFKLNTSQQVVQVFEGHQRRINAAVVYTSKDHHNEPIVASCDGAGKLLIWKPHNSADEKAVISSQSDKKVPVTLTLAIYDPYRYGRNTEKNTARQSKGIAYPSSPIKIDLGKAWILSGGGEYDIKVWDFDGRLHHTIKNAHEHLVRSLVIHHPVSPDEKPFILSGSYDKTAKLWDLETLKLLCVFKNYHTNYVFFTAIYDPQVQYGIFKNEKDEFYHEKTTVAIITSSYDGSFAIWNRDSTISSSFSSPVEITEPRLPKASGGLRLGHKEAITALAVYTPPEGNEDPPILITGSLDQLIHLWNLFTGEKLQTLVGHIDRVCWIKVYQPPDSSRSAMILSGGDDGKTIQWEDSLYYQNHLPLPEDVKRCFQVDVQFSSKTWPLISTLVEMFRERFFFSHSYLFYLAILNRQSEFLLLFEKYFGKVFLSLPNFRREIAASVKERETGDLLSLAIELRDDRAVHLIIKQWIWHLSLEIEDSLSLHCYHAMHLFPYHSLPALLRYYPSEFGLLIESLRVIPYYIGESTQHTSDFGIHKSKPKELLSEKFYLRRENISQAASVTAKEEIKESGEGEEEKEEAAQSILLNNLLETEDYLWFVDKWIVILLRWYLKRFYPKARGSEVTGILPFLFQLQKKGKGQKRPPQKTAYQLLEMIYTYSERSDEDEIFQCEACEVLIDYCWESRGRTIHVFAGIKYMIFLIVFTLAIFTYTSSQPYESSLVAYVLGILSLVGFIWHGKDEFNQFHRTLREIQLDSSDNAVYLVLVLRALGTHLYDAWNILDVITIVSGMTGLVLRIVYNNDTPTERSFLALASVLLWFKFLYYLRPFHQTGPLAAMVIEITIQIQLYLVLLFCVLAGYAQAFWTLSNDSGLADDGSSLPFGTISQAFYNTFFYMLGQNIDTLFPGSTGSPYIASLFLVSFMMVMMILMFNLLIALMGDICTKIREKGSAQWRKEQARVLLEERFFLTDEALALDPHILVIYKG